MGVFGETCLKTDIIFALPFGGAINGEISAFSIYKKRKNCLWTLEDLEYSAWTTFTPPFLGH